MLSHQRFRSHTQTYEYGRKYILKKIHIFILKRLDPTHTFIYHHKCHFGNLTEKYVILYTRRIFIPENHNHVQKEMLLSSPFHTPPILSSGKILIAFMKKESGKIPPLLSMNCGETIMSCYGVNKNPTRCNNMQIIIYCILLHLVGFLLTLNYDTRNHELKKKKVLLWINTYSLSYSLTSTFRGCETQWMKALGFSPTDVGSHFTSSSTTVPSESFNTLVTEMR